MDKKMAEIFAIQVAKYGGNVKLFFGNEKFFQTFL